MKVCLRKRGVAYLSKTGPVYAEMVAAIWVSPSYFLVFQP